ncbi:MAG: hypothetical protein AAB333_07005, partial [Pseudomonadota bacterium]
QAGIQNIIDFIDSNILDPGFRRGDEEFFSNLLINIFVRVRKRVREVLTLLHWVSGSGPHEVADQLERDKRQHHDDDEENDRAVFKAVAAPGLDAIQNPVGGEVKPYPHECEINYFHGVCAPC